MSAREEAWDVPEGRSWLHGMLPVAIGESRRHPLALAGLFACIALGALALGLLLPKNYTASTTLRVEERGIAPLSETAPPPPAVAERAARAREIALSPEVLDSVLAVGGWRTRPGSVEHERLAQDIASRMEVSNPDENLVRIAYTDADPGRALAVVRRLGERVAGESLAASARQSRAAFQFLDAQVEQYRRRLAASAAQLADYRAIHPDAMFDIEADSAAISELRRQVAASRIDLAAQRAQESALRAQLASVGGGGGRNAQLGELQAELDKLRVEYTDQHPDVVRLRHRMQELEAELSSARTPRPSGHRVAPANPAYADLQTRVGEASGLTAAAASRVAMGEALLDRALTREGRTSSATQDNLDELTRNHEVNRELYQALLKRREEARLAMDLDARHGGPGMSVQEPAVLPLSPVGLRLRHVAVVGLGMAVLAPLLVLFALARLDPRARSATQVERGAGLPVLGVIPAAHAGTGLLSDRRMVLAALLVAGVLLLYGLVLLWKLVQSA